MRTATATTNIDSMAASSRYVFLDDLRPVLPEEDDRPDRADERQRLMITEHRKFCVPIGNEKQISCT